MILATKAAIAHSGVGLPYQWVAAGLNGELYTSTTTDGSSWTQRTSSFGSDVITSVASNGVDLYIAVGHAGKLATSPDGINWTQRTSGYGTDNINRIAYGNGYWVTIGELGKSAYSTDGITWTLNSANTSTNLGGAIFYGDGLWTAGTGTGIYRTATDPTGTWTTRTSTITAGLPYAYYAPDQAIWVAGSDSGTTGSLASSADGITWTARTSSFSSNTSAVIVPAVFVSDGNVIIMGKTLNFFTPDLDVQTSTNGTTWTNRTPAVTASRCDWIAVDENSNFIMVSSVLGDDFQYTTDGVTWTTKPGISGKGFYAICHSSGLPSIR